VQAADATWTEAIRLAPTNAPALSNRGTVRLQAGACLKLLEARGILCILLMTAVASVEAAGVRGSIMQLDSKGFA
jgi:hypothetical protein